MTWRRYVGSAGASLTGKDCTPYSIHYGYDTTALGNGTATTMVKQGGKTWFFLTADYAFGTQLQEAAAKIVEKNGGKVIGAVRVPLATADFSSFLVQALGYQAVKAGFAVLYRSIFDVVRDFLHDEALGGA